MGKSKGAPWRCYWIVRAKKLATTCRVICAMIARANTQPAVCFPQRGRISLVTVNDARAAAPKRGNPKGGVCDHRWGDDGQTAGQRKGDIIAAAAKCLSPLLSREPRI
eukprot:GGOE01053396.1.p20 GENE.GGOE01053396.1~~GGOE01053396.1.p20  ORF type:complete len:108 (+),score=2.21 GGOE01053396.1:808-1131(+)